MNPEKLLGELSVHQRGLLLTIFACSQQSPNYVLAACKHEINFAKNVADLCELHERSFIEWSGYTKAKKSLEKKTKKEENDPNVREAVVFMNTVFKRKFNPEGKNLTLLQAVFNEGYTLEQVKKVIANRYEEWKDDPVSKKWLNTATPFRKKMFPVYLEEAERTRKGESHLAAQAINLQDGDEVTGKVAETFTDKDTYKIKVYRTDSNSEIRGTGTIAIRYGKDIKRALRIEDDKEKFDGFREYRYFYKTN